MANTAIENAKLLLEQAKAALKAAKDEGKKMPQIYRACLLAGERDTPASITAALNVARNGDNVSEAVVRNCLAQVKVITSIQREMQFGNGNVDVDAFRPKEETPTAAVVNLRKTG